MKSVGLFGGHRSCLQDPLWLGTGQAWLCSPWGTGLWHLGHPNSSCDNCLQKHPGDPTVAGPVLGAGRLGMPGPHVQPVVSSGPHGALMWADCPIDRGGSRGAWPAQDRRAGGTGPDSTLAASPCSTLTFLIAVKRVDVAFSLGRVMAYFRSQEKPPRVPHPVHMLS